MMRSGPLPWWTAETPDEATCRIAATLRAVCRTGTRLRPELMAIVAILTPGDARG